VPNTAISPAVTASEVPIAQQAAQDIWISLLLVGEQEEADPAGKHRRPAGVERGEHAGAERERERGAHAGSARSAARNADRLGPTRRARMRPARSITITVSTTVTPQSWAILPSGSAM
jgi:hypothetical protein